MTARTYNSNLNNLQQAQMASESVVRRELDSVKKKVENAERKLKERDEEINQKNGFIQRYIAGQAKR